MYFGADVISNFIPEYDCKQSSSERLTEYFIKDRQINNILDLGCGEGDSIDFFRKIAPNAKWIGIDIENSQEVNRRKRTDAKFMVFDGINLPFEDNFFDLIFCKQVFEHVHHPFKLMDEVGRVLRYGGIFVGSTSHLEAFHSMSTFNYTPYGFSLLIENSDLFFIELRPGIDVLTLLILRLFNRSKILSHFFSRYFEKESPLNILFEIAGKITGKSKKDINLLKLLFCGQFVFCISKKEK